MMKRLPIEINRVTNTQVTRIEDVGLQQEKGKNRNCMITLMLRMSIVVCESVLLSECKSICIKINFGCIHIQTETSSSNLAHVPTLNISIIPH